jgi:hypothetical protein
MNIYEIVESGQVVLSADEEMGVLITWNGNSILNLWVGDYSMGNWHNTDVRTRYDIDGSLGKALEESSEWLLEMEQGRYENH